MGLHGGYISHPTEQPDPNFHTICANCDTIISHDGYPYSTVYMNRDYYPKREDLERGQNEFEAYCKACRNNITYHKGRNYRRKQDPKFTEYKRDQSAISRENKRAARMSNAKSEEERKEIEKRANRAFAGWNTRRANAAASTGSTISGDAQRGTGIAASSTAAFQSRFAMPPQETTYYQTSSGNRYPNSPYISNQPQTSSAHINSGHQGGPTASQASVSSSIYSSSQSGYAQDRHTGPRASQAAASEFRSSLSQSQLAHGDRSHSGSFRSSGTFFDAIGDAGGRSSRPRSTLSRLEENPEDYGLTSDEERWRGR